MCRNLVLNYACISKSISTRGSSEETFMDAFRDSMLQLITQTSTNLPPDVRRAMARAMGEEQGGRSLQALNVIATNIDMATDNEGPICQDTGWPTFEIKTPVGANQLVMKKEI